MVIMRSVRSFRKINGSKPKVKFKCINFILINHLYKDFKSWCIGKGYFYNGVFVKSQNKCAYLYLSTHHYLEDLRASIIAGGVSYSELFNTAQWSYL